jgi:hypothetical protein
MEFKKHSKQYIIRINNQPGTWIFIIGSALMAISSWWKISREGFHNMLNEEPAKLICEISNMLGGLVRIATT